MSWFAEDEFSGFHRFRFFKKHSMNLPLRQGMGHAACQHWKRERLEASIRSVVKARASSQSRGRGGSHGNDADCGAKGSAPVTGGILEHAAEDADSFSSEHLCGKAFR